MKFALLISPLLLAGMVSAAQAHITFENHQAAVGGTVKAVLQVGHGCEGSDTTRIRVRIPEGVLSAKPQPKAGWTLAVTPDAAGGVREIAWTGDLPDAWYDKFTFRATLAPTLKVGDTLYFPVVQECKQGVARWIDTSGKAHADGPAPGLKLTAPTSTGHHH